MCGLAPSVCLVIEIALKIIIIFCTCAVVYSLRTRHCTLPHLAILSVCMYTCNTVFVGIDAGSFLESRCQLSHSKIEEGLEWNLGLNRCTAHAGSLKPN